MSTLKDPFENDGLYSRESKKEGIICLLTLCAAFLANMAGHSWFAVLLYCKAAFDGVCCLAYAFKSFFKD